MSVTFFAFSIGFWGLFSFYKRYGWWSRCLRLSESWILNYRLGSMAFQTSLPEQQNGCSYYWKVFNLSLLNGVFPENWKYSVVLIFNYAICSDVSNYHPVSILSALTKVFHKVTHSRLYNYFKRKFVLFAARVFSREIRWNKFMPFLNYS